MQNNPNYYCKFIESLSQKDGDLHLKYHNTQYGFPIVNDNELFCRLILEINQAGLSWTTILKKESTFRAAYHNFEIEKVASYESEDIQRLLSNPGIIRNKKKIEAAIYNANVILKLKQNFGSFHNWLVHNHPKGIKEWAQLFKSTFQFTGGEIVKEFLMSIGILEGAHNPECPIYKKVEERKPLWLSAKENTCHAVP